MDQYLHFCDTVNRKNRLITSLKDEIDIIKRNYAKLSYDFELFKEFSSHMQKDLDAKKTRITELQKIIERDEKKFQKRLVQFSEREEGYSSLMEKNKELQDKIQELDDTIDRIRREMDEKRKCLEESASFYRRNCNHKSDIIRNLNTEMENAKSVNLLNESNNKMNSLKSDFQNTLCNKDMVHKLELKIKERELDKVNTDLKIQKIGKLRSRSFHERSTRLPPIVINKVDMLLHNETKSRLLLNNDTMSCNNNDEERERPVTRAQRMSAPSSLFNSHNNKLVSTTVPFWQKYF